MLKQYLDDEFEMSDKTVAILVRSLEQNEGKLSKIAREKEFIELTDQQSSMIENAYNKSFN